MRHNNKISVVLFAAMVWMSGFAHAVEVTVRHGDISLIGELSIPEGATLADGPLVLMTHGTLAHGGMEIMQALQTALLERGVASLAVNLSLGLDKRRGMYDCGTTHVHRHTDAMDEIGTWLAFAKKQGAKEIVLLGHSRGGNQTAWFAAEHDDAALNKVVLIAPTTWTREHVHESYRKTYGKDLKPIYERAKKMVDGQKGQEILEKVDFIYCPGAQVMASSFVNYYADEPRMDTPGLLNKINERVLVIAGGEDTIVADLREKVTPIAESGKVDLVVVDGADHFFRDLYAEEAVDAITAFLKK